MSSRTAASLLGQVTGAEPESVHNSREVYLLRGKHQIKAALDKHVSMPMGAICCVYKKGTKASLTPEGPAAGAHGSVLPAPAVTMTAL